MIQLNLLPDIKLDFLKAQRMKRIVILASLAITALSIAVVIILSFVVFVWDRKSTNDLTADIKKYRSDMGDIGEINKALTIQYQLTSLKDLHDKKPILSRLNNMLITVIPNEISLSGVKVDTVGNTIEMVGEGKTLERVNTLADSLKFAYYKVPDTDDEKQSPFSAVTLSSVDFDGKTASVKVTMTYDPIIFDRTKNVVVEIEKGKVTSRAVVEKPNPLFIKPTEKKQ